MIPDVDTWLQSMGFAEYRELFRANDIDAALLPQLTDADLKELGVASLGQRKRLLAAITSLGSVPASAAAPAGAAEATSTADAERRQLTVMFVDLIGSTALSAALDPEDLREVITAYQNAVAGEVSRMSGHVAQYLGDGVLVYFGWPRAHEDDAERAVRAGLAVRDSVARLAGPADARLQVRIGIATGIVVVGDLIAEGTAQRHAVVGETPNLAARLQALAAPGKVLIADSTRQLVGDLFDLHDSGLMTVKGISMPVRVYTVAGERASESRFIAHRMGSLAPVAGREQELALLRERWLRAQAGEGQLVLLSGEAGIGKSRIVEALIETAEQEPHWLLRYQCSPYHGDSALYPVLQQLSHAAGFAPDDNAERRRERLAGLMSLATDDIAASLPLLAALLGIDANATAGLGTLTPAQKRSRTLAALVDQLTGLAQHKPVLWVIEDAHWIDPTTLELIELALGSVQDARVLALVTSRPEFAAPFATHPVVTRLALNRLGRAATQAIVAHITHGKRLPEVLLDEIVARTDGVPLFIEETTKAVIESGLLDETAAGYELRGPVSALAIPATLHDSLMARLDRLQPVKALAQTAAVIGRNFDYDTLAALCRLPEAELGSGLQQLLAAELIFRRGTPPAASYLFKHALVRDAAYASLLKPRRTELHCRLVDVLERHGVATPEVKAHHAEAAGLTERALDYWAEAGALAVARPAYQEAIASLANAIRLCRALGDTPRWKRREQGLQLQLGQALIALRGYAAAATLEAFERALALADELDDITLALPATYGLVAYTYVAGKPTLAAAKRFCALTERQPESGPRLVARRHLGIAYFHEGLFEEARDLYREVIAGYEPAAHRALIHSYGQDNRVAAQCYLAVVLWVLGFPAQAADAAEQGLDWATEVGHPFSLAYMRNIGADWTYIWLRNAERVAHIARENLRLADAMSIAVFQAWSRIDLGWALAQRGEAQGLAEIEGGLRQKQQTGARRMEQFHLSLVADAYAREGRFDEALNSNAKAFEQLALLGDKAFTAELHRQRANLWHRSGAGEFTAVVAELSRALDIARAQQARAFELRAARDLAGIWAVRGERERAVDLLAPVYSTFTEGFDTPDLCEARDLLDALGH